MSKKEIKPEPTIQIIKLHRHELPLYCPRADVPLWSAHPRVYLPIEETGDEVCPYCSTRFILKD